MGEDVLDRLQARFESAHLLGGDREVELAGDARDLRGAFDDHITAYYQCPSGKGQA